MSSLIVLVGGASLIGLFIWGYLNQPRPRPILPWRAFSAPGWVNWKRIKTWLIVGSVYAVLLTAYHLARPEIDLTMSDVETDATSGDLDLISFKLQNGAFIDLKDPTVACDMKGPSGTTIKTVTKTIYEVLPAENTRMFGSLRMGKTPDQATQFQCYVKSASVKW